MKTRINRRHLGMLLALSVVVWPFAAPVRGADLGVLDASGDVGPVKLSGTVRYDSKTQRYAIVGAGSNMWANEDEFQFAWKRIRGDFIVRARAEFLGAGSHAHRKLGWIARTSLDADSAHVNAAVHGDGLASLQFRRAAGGTTEEIRSSVTHPDVIQLERRGCTFTMSVAKFGEPFSVTTVSDVELGEVLYVGLYVCSHDAAVREEALFQNVRVIAPASANFVPYRDYIGSRLETLDVATGERQILMSTPDAVEAPNWTVDGQALVYNSQGRLFRFDLANRRPELLDTGDRVKNNNDHVFSPDGTMLGISGRDGETGRESLIFTLPAGGGTPRNVTLQGPSYLHGWSPDGKSLVYTARRDGDFDIYRIPSDGGEEVRLTTAPGLDDGAEYSRDGRQIYFCSARSGLMQIWRMNPDGSRHEQVTDDALNNWFPHVSPDGKWVVFLSFSKDIPPDDHPYYKQVYLRLMPIDGGKPRIVAYVYGGQGTLNVPSWSPDSRCVALVSNSTLPIPQ